MTSTVGSLLNEATALLGHTSPTPRLDAEVLLRHITGFTRAQLITHAADALTSEQQSQLQKLLTRRAQGEPVAYLTGTREFWSLELHVTPDVLIPRPDTELLVEQALRLIPPEAHWQIADLGTGSGAVALAIAAERPGCRIVATDSSAAALAVARRNAQRLGITNVTFHQGEWFTPLTDLKFEMIVSNPPYIVANDPHLQQGDLRFEPSTALVAGPEGLDAIQGITREAPAHLQPGGHLLLEHGAGQAEAMARLLAKQGYTSIVLCRDLAGLPRVTVARPG